jgi:glycosyltransferase involved in cell wall biosynthesis
VSASNADRIPVLYLAPWVDYGGTSKGTLDWFRTIDRDRYAPSLVLTQQPSPNRLLSQVEPYAEELWNLPDLMPGGEFPFFIADFVQTREVQLVHVMNSRLGFELLPDLCCLPEPPAIVVQLHVEEDSRSGYVRYVTTRYGNLVDAFSVSSRHLADAMISDYDVSPGKCHVIYTGVDADEEFAPSRAEPVDGLEDGMVHILFLGRLVEQKDPLLMVAVADRLRRRDERFCVHVVGDGPLQADVRTAVAERGLERHVRLEGPTDAPAGWYAGCDLLLMTSVFEGIPYVLFEAMAMGLPAVVPTLPGTLEVVGDASERVIAPRDDVERYADAIAALMADGDERLRLGKEARRRVLKDFSLRRMASGHDVLYQRLLARRAGPARPGMVV